MACFSACVAEAIVAFGVKKTLEHHEKAVGTYNEHSLSNKLSLLIKMLLGGSLLLLVAHIWHGEISFFYPFLTAMNSPEDTQEMLHEILTVGGSMDLAITSVWAVIAFAKSFTKSLLGDKA